MNINELFFELKDITINASMPIPFCNSDEGIKLLLPAPYSAKAGTIFAGSLSDWDMALRQHLIYDGCTYLVCSNGETPEVPSGNLNINVFFLDASMRIVLQRLSTLFSKKQTLDSSVISKLYRDFWNDILSMQLTTKAQILERIRQFPYHMHRHIACIVIRHSQPHHEATFIHNITCILQEFFHETNLFFTGEEWIILYSQEEDTSDTLSISYDSFSNLLEKYQLDAGLSYVCQLPDILRTLYLTASAAIDLGKGLGIAPYKKRIYTYHQYNPYYVIHLCSHSFKELHKTENLVYLTHPDITRLYYYDVENNSNLLDVLSAYLSCGQNVNQTSQMLYMHRNTVLNKLNKIEEFLQHEFDYNTDHFLLLLSCMILRYQHQYTQRKVSDYFVSHRFEFAPSNDTDFDKCP
ncbi:MAG: helix-turn-helix domain-containing protein [Lachnospiraceae bacterium]|nr:helix-turn-helix domain-containing protein [Lachnospiraceae bacterium]